MRAFAGMQRAEAAKLARSEQNPLALAVKALEADNTDLATNHWEDARNRTPDHVMQSEDTIKVLLRLNRLDELEALMLAGHKKSPRVELYKLGLAQLNERRQRFTEAAKWWSSIRIGSSFGVENWKSEAHCLELAGELAASANVLHHAARLFADRADVWSRLASIYERLQNWPEALRAWDYVAETLRDGGGYAGAARVCVAMKDPDGAGRRITAGYTKTPYSFDLLKIMAEFAEQSADLPRAMRLWAELRMAHPQLDTGYREEIRCLLRAGDTAKADRVFAEAERRFPGRITYPP
jgi:tetratricopeptide (TPR) repeat protein